MKKLLMITLLIFGSNAWASENEVCVVQVLHSIDQTYNSSYEEAIRQLENCGEKSNVFLEIRKSQYDDFLILAASYCELGTVLFLSSSSGLACKYEKHDISKYGKRTKISAGITWENPPSIQEN